MHIYIDIGHPAHAHALRFFIAGMQERGHKVLVSARDKDITHCLLNAWDISFIGRGKGALFLPGKMLDLTGVLLRLLPRVRRFAPDLVVSWSSYQAALIGRLLGKPVITFEDTENVPLLHMVNRFLSTTIATPACFEMDMGASQMRFNGYKELASLHPARAVQLPLPPGIEKPFILLRFVSWKAWHDRGHHGIGEKMKHIVAERLSEFGRVYISSEDPLPPGFYRYRLPVGCDMLHSLLAQASLLFGESASMAAEAAVLGVPAIFIDNEGRGYTRELEREHGLLYNFREDEEGVLKALNKCAELLGDTALHMKWQAKREKMLKGKVDLTTWMITLAESAADGRLQP